MVIVTHLLILQIFEHGIFHGIYCVERQIDAGMVSERL